MRPTRGRYCRTWGFTVREIAREHWPDTHCVADLVVSAAAIAAQPPPRRTKHIENNTNHRLWDFIVASLEKTSTETPRTSLVRLAKDRAGFTPATQT